MSLVPAKFPECEIGYAQPCISEKEEVHYE